MFFGIVVDDVMYVVFVWCDGVMGCGAVNFVVGVVCIFVKVAACCDKFLGVVIMDDFVLICMVFIFIFFVMCCGFVGLIVDVYCGVSDRNGVCCVCCVGSYRFFFIFVSMYLIVFEGLVLKFNFCFKIFIVFFLFLNVYLNVVYLY